MGRLLDDSNFEFWVDRDAAFRLSSLRPCVLASLRPDVLTSSREGGDGAVRKCMRGLLGVDVAAMRIGSGWELEVRGGLESNRG